MPDSIDKVAGAWATRVGRGARTGNGRKAEIIWVCERTYASTAERNLGGHVDVGGVLVLAQQRNVQEDSKRSGVGSEHDNLGGSTVESLGSLVGSLLELAVVGSRLDQIQDLLGHGGVGDGPRGGLVLVRHDDGVDGVWIVEDDEQGSFP